MATSRFSIALLAFALLPAFAQAPAPSAGNGLYAVPASAAYADLTNAANHILDDIGANFRAADTIVMYDPQTFATVVYYQSALELVKGAMGAICKAEKPAGFAGPHLAIAPTLDFGSAASGLAALIGVTLPAYAIQGQALPLDNTAFIGAFAAAAKNRKYDVVIPAYLLPAAPSTNEALSCASSAASNSLADLWSALNAETYKASKLSNADTSPLKDALAQNQKITDVYLASDKGPPLLGKLLTVQVLGSLFADPAKLSKVVVVDIKLDAAGMDSTTKTVLWWRKTKVSSNVLGHYALLGVAGSGTQFSLTLVKPGYVNVLTKNLNQGDFATSETPQGVINPCPAGQSRVEKKSCVPAKQ